jgi:hypothetical protein
MTINKALELVLSETGSTSEVNRVSMRPGEDKQAVVEISDQGWKDLTDHLGYTPADLTPMGEAFAKTIQWYKENLGKFHWTG